MWHTYLRMSHFLHYVKPPTLCQASYAMLSILRYVKPPTLCQASYAMSSLLHNDIPLHLCHDYKVSLHSAATNQTEIHNIKFCFSYYRWLLLYTILSVAGEKVSIIEACRQVFMRFSYLVLTSQILAFLLAMLKYRYVLHKVDSLTFSFCCLPFCSLSKKGISTKGVCALSAALQVNQSLLELK